MTPSSSPSPDDRAEPDARGGRISRRTLLRVSAGAGAGLTLGLTLGPSLPGRSAAAATAGADEDTFAPNAFVRIAPDDTVTVIIKHLEMGQGVFTGLCTLVAEELGASWTQIRPEHAPADAERYNNLYWGPVQGTGNSSSMANAFDQMRRAGAVAREMIRQAAADLWEVDPADVTIRDGTVHHTASGRTTSFGALVDRAAALPLPDPGTVPLTDPSNFRLIGRPGVPRPDTADKVRGRTVYASDVRLKGMLSAVVRRPPRFGARVREVNDAAALAMPGVQAVVPLAAGVAVVAETTWQALKARDALKVDWDESTAVRTGSAALMESFRDLARTPGQPVRRDGDVLSALSDPDARVVEAVYEMPYLAHAPMEPPSAVARLTTTGLEVWAGSQMPTFDVLAIAEAAGLRPDQITLNTVPAGGSFGRRAAPDGGAAAEVAAIVRGLADRGIEHPVQLLWMREDDLRAGGYRPMALHALSGALGPGGRPVAWRQRVVCPSVLRGTIFGEALIRDGIDPTSVEGVSDLPYALPNIAAELHSPDPGIPVQWWRSVGRSHTIFAVESFIDEMAHAAAIDPLILRLDLLRDHPRLLGVLLRAAEEAGWGLPLPERRGQGLAVHQAAGTCVAHVAEVTATDDGVRVDRLVCAIDCGLAVNPDIVRAQVEGAAVFGLSAALRSRLTLDDSGLVDQSNFHDYEVLRLRDMPVIEVHILPSSRPPGGVGEPGVPTVAPAVANALFAASGRRVRSLPLTKA